MKAGWELCINLIEIVIIFDFLIRYFGYVRKDRKSYCITAVMGMTAFLMLTFFNFNYTFEMLSVVLMILINFAFCVMVLKGKLLEKAFVVVFLMGLVGVVAGGTALLFGYMYSVDVGEVLAVFNPVRVTAVLVSKIAFFWSTRIVLRFKKHSKLTVVECVQLLIIPLCSMAIIFFLMKAAFQSPGVQSYIFGALLMLGVIDALIYYLFLRISAANELKQEYALLELQYQCEQKNAVETQRLYEEVRSARHDLKNHLLCIEGLAASQKYQEIQEYIQSYIQQEEQSERTILFTENKILDAILNVKMAAAAAKGIHCNTMLTCSSIPLAKSDICVLFGNLLDNAIEAAERTSEKRIEIDISRHDKYVMISVSNSIECAVLGTNPKLLTSKADKKAHGFGTRNIQKIVEKYQGILQYSERENTFICDIMLPVITNYVPKPTKLVQTIEI